MDNVSQAATKLKSDKRNTIILNEGMRKNPYTRREEVKR